MMLTGNGLVSPPRCLVKHRITPALAIMLMAVGVLAITLAIVLFATQERYKQHVLSDYI